MPFAVRKGFARFDVKAIIGSGFLWAWFDALFMSVFFSPSGQQGFMSEIAAICIFAFGVPLYVVTMRRSDAMRRLLARKKIMAAVAVAGAVGSLVLVCAGFADSWTLLFAGAALCAIFMGFAGLAWGAVYSSDGARSAMVYVAGGFAFAFVVDVPLLLMIPVASACFFALLPAASLLMLARVDPKLSTYGFRNELTTSSEQNLAERLRSSFGVSLPALGAVMLIMIGFGYVQHLASFAPQAVESAIGGGVLIQVVRGMVAVVAFLVVLVAPKRASWMYRLGLLAMVAGFSLMPFLYDGQSFEASGAVIIGGYTVFDVLSWVIFSQVAHTRSSEPVKTIAVMRLAVGACYAAGAAIAIVLSFAMPTNAHGYEEAMFVGYLMTVAIVLLLTSKEVWELFAPQVLVRPVAEVSPNVEDRPDDVLQERCQEWGFTQREQEIIRLLAVGRTQPWIAESLGISENTVNTHVRRIYQKMGVHSRQELIDLVLNA